MSRITTDFKYSLLQFFRSWQSVFFAFVFPLLFLVLAWFLFSGQAGPQALYYVDQDGSPASAALIASLNATTGVRPVNGSGMDLAEMLREGQIAAYVEIPPGFGESVGAARQNGSPVNITMYYDRSRTDSSILVTAVQHAVSEINRGLDQAGNAARLTTVGVASAMSGYAAFLLPGILGIAIMGSAVDTTVSYIAKLRSSGLFRKLSVTPIRRLEWNASRVATGVTVSIFAIIVSIVAAWIAFGITPAVNIVSVLLVLAGSVMFVGLGMIIAYLVKGSESANAALTVTLPLIFISGSIIPVGEMPWFLKALAAISPLTYLNNGLRSGMITRNMADAWVNFAIVAALAIVFFGIGIAVLKWRDD